CARYGDGSNYFEDW
nr:immunoglobulin heavy chain junction region [Macaca mulatta]